MFRPYEIFVYASKKPLQIRQLPGTTREATHNRSNAYRLVQPSKSTVFGPVLVLIAKRFNHGLTEQPKLSQDKGTIDKAKQEKAAEISAVNPGAASTLPNPPPRPPEKVHKTFLQRFNNGEYNLYWVAHMGNVISACALTVSDILWLRSLMILASCCGLVVNYAVIKPRFWVGIYWGLFFLLLNTTQIARILLDRKTVTLQDDEGSLYDAVFNRVYTPPEFKKLLRSGSIVTFEPEEMLLKEGDAINKVYVIIDGACRVEERDGNDQRFITLLKNGQLVGETALLPGAGIAAAATVITQKKTKCIVWKREDLQKLFFRLPSLAIGWNAIISSNLLSRLKEQTQLSKENQYKLFLYGILTDGRVSKEERKAVEVYATNQNITPDLHEKALSELGWTVEEWNRGSQTKGFWETVYHGTTEIASTIANAPEVVRSVFVGHREEPELLKPENPPAVSPPEEKVLVSEPLDIVPVFDTPPETTPKEEEKDAQKLMETPFVPP